MALILEQETYSILGACFEVYKDKGCGFLEAVYAECLELEFSEAKIPFVREMPLQLTYKGSPLKQSYLADFYVFESVIVELKAVKSLEDVHRAQLHNYLKATGLKVGLLVNFGHYPKLEHERIIH